MSNDINEGQWRQMRGSVKEKWGKLTDDEVEEMEGKFENFYGKMQEKYGMSKQQAREAFEDLRR
ncbi:CsbD family protein [Bowmanella dokdonensis]|uniref:CsbD family protein n=1 Tax=Bowmanella dokdonensis TaxID=751969 RepID=A0A939IQU5_9ALTE|nr:CsbD family protein [Bowmanella dokdonensis]MBN7824957.1 CsbD family protein [Bowmanella dokdonensis]